MHLVVVNLLYGLAAAITGAAASWWLCRFHFRRKIQVQSSSEARQAAEVLARLHDLTTRVALDVRAHTNEVEEINGRLNSAGGQEPSTIVDVVAQLIQTNQRMQDKLTSTEDKLRDQAQQMEVHAVEARTDALTLLANRRAFDGELARRIAEFRRQRRAFALLMADVDRFKLFNDTHGHQMGDAVLRDVARLLRCTMREMDLVARYGGEEFAVVLPGTDQAAASEAALRARKAIEEHPFRHDGKELRVTASFGVAAVLGNEDGAALVARADQALYAAKEGGRNCAYWHDGKTAHRVADNREPVPPRDAEKQPPPAIAVCGAADGWENGPPAADGSTKQEAAFLHALELDPASGLPSRTTFCQQVRQRTAEWKRGGPTFSVALIQVDQGNEAAENGGQQARRAAVAATTRFLTATMREMDFLAHYASGCFALLLPTAGLADAIHIIERLLSRAGECDAERGQRPALSAGVVQITRKDNSISLLQRAEAALDAAGRQGGDGACYHDGECCIPITGMLVST